MEELGLDYKLETFLRQPDLYGPPAMKDVHALGRAPIIRDGDVLLAESGAIVEYLIARHGQGRLSVPPSEPNFPRYPAIQAYVARLVARPAFQKAVQPAEGWRLNKRANGRTAEAKRHPPPSAARRRMALRLSALRRLCQDLSEHRGDELS